jgi:lipoteichoic acid synthase
MQKKSTLSWRERFQYFIRHSNILEFLVIALIVLSLDAIFIYRYRFDISGRHLILAGINVVFILSWIALIKRNKYRYMAYALYMAVMFTFFLTDSTLYYFKQDVTSLAMLLESGKNTMRIGIKYNPLTPYGLLVWTMIITVIVLFLRFLRRLVYMQSETAALKQGRKKLIIALCFTLMIMLSPWMVEEKERLTFQTPADKSLFVQRFGYITYHNLDIVTFAASRIRPLFFTDEYIENINEHSRYELSETSPYFGEFKDQNVIMIMCETCEEYAFIPDLTPNYYALREKSVAFDQFYSAAKNNYTYDAEMKALTSMMYSLSDNYMYTFGENTYQNALPHVLREKGYTANSFHNYDVTFFNRDTMHTSLGFEHFLALEDEEIDQGDYWPLDSIMFADWHDRIAPVQDDPFFSFVLTVTPHGPHTKYREELKAYYDIIEEHPIYRDYEDEFKTLLAAQMDFDKGLGILLDHLEDTDLIDETIIVMFSDHKNYSSFEITEKYTEDSDVPYAIERVPMLIYHDRLQPKVSETLGSHYDVTPTVFDLLGIRYFQDFYHGESLFLEERTDRPIILTHSSWISSEMVVQADEVVRGNDDPENYVAVKQKIHDTIEYYEQMFFSDYFADHVSIPEDNE